MPKDAKKAFSDSKKYLYKWLNSEGQRRGRTHTAATAKRLEAVLETLHKQDKPMRSKAGPHNP